MRSINATQVRAVVGFTDLIEPMERAFIATARGEADNKAFMLYPQIDRSRADVMVKAGIVANEPIFVVKVAPWYANRAETGQPQGGLFMIFDAGSGCPIAAIDDEHYISDIRTAAAGALAARHLAPRKVRTAAVLGSGRQAELQSLALYRERPFVELLIWARRREGGEGLVTRLAPQLPLVAVRIVSDCEMAVRQADVIITTTSATCPIVQGDWLRSGQHITAVGADDKTKCELAPDCLLRADRVVVDDRATALETGELHRALTQGFDLGDRVVEFGSIIDGPTVRRANNEITIATFSGIGAQDVCAATALVEKLALKLPYR